jgi:TPR repeat protein
MRTKISLATIAALTLLLSPSGHAERVEEKTEIGTKIGVAHINVREITARANAGNAQAQFSLGLIYEEGRDGNKRDLAYALSWYEEAARNGFKRAAEKIRQITASVE